MSTTAQDICQDAAEMLQIYGAGETMTDADATRLLSVLNDMIDSWSNERLMTYATQTISFPLVVQKFQYTIGAGGDVNVTRPLKLRDAIGAAYLLDQQSNKYGMDVVDQDTWNLKTTSQVTTNLPDTIWYDPQFPLGILNLWGTPTIGYTCYIQADLQLVEFATLATAFSLPPGYKLAMGTNLAVAAKPYFLKSQLDPIVAERARESKGNIKRTNIKKMTAVYDPEIVARGQTTYNIRTDNAGRS